MFLKYAIGLTLALIFVVVLSQIIVPLWRGHPLFPAFGRRARLERELARWRQDEEERRLEREIAARAAAAFEVESLPSSTAVNRPRKELDHE